MLDSMTGGNPVAAGPTLKLLKPAKDANKVIILGAGASASDGAPLQGDLFRRYAEIIQREANNLEHAASEGEIRTFFDLFWGADINAADLSKEHFPTFEEALGLLELANTRGEFFKGFAGLQTEATRAQELRAHLVNLIALVLDRCLRHDAHTHNSLVENLRTAAWLNKTVFLSFNYDLLIDNALSRILGADPDYAVAVRTPANPATAGTTLLKIHGSLNWLFCPTCNELDIFPGEKIVAGILTDPGRMTCDSCQEPRVPIVIPPTFFKVMSNFCLQQIWKKAEEVLREADHLIFCGYSFPDADLHFKYLLKRAEINRPDFSPKRLEVFIVNEHTGKRADAREAERDRYLRFFRNKGLVHWTKLSFADFAANPERYSDPSCWG